jgi:hypothetical protein
MLELLKQWGLSDIDVVFAQHQDGFRSFGHANITTTEKADLYAEQIAAGIEDVLDKVIPKATLLLLFIKTF